MKRNLRWIIMIIVLGCLLSCSEKEQADSSPVIAGINGDKLTEDMLIEFSGVSSLTELPDSEKRKHIDNWIKISLLAQEADNTGLTDNSRIRARIKLAEKSIKANHYLSTLFHNIEPTENELFNYYQIHKGRYLQDRDEYRIQRIFLNNEATADSISRAIVRNEITFGAAARSFSQEAARENDGYLGYLTLEEMDGHTRRAIGNLSQWRYIKVSGNNGFYLVRYTDQRAREAEKSFTDVIDEIKEEYLSERRKDYIDEAIEELMRRAEVDITR